MGGPCYYSAHFPMRCGVYTTHSTGIPTREAFIKIEINKQTVRTSYVFVSNVTTTFTRNLH